MDQEVEELLAKCGTGSGTMVRYKLERMGAVIQPILVRALEDAAFRADLWQRFGKAHEGEKPQIEIRGITVNASEPTSFETFERSLTSWALAILLQLPAAHEEPLSTLLKKAHREQRRAALESRYDSKAGKTFRRPATPKQNRWWSFLEACEDGDLSAVQAAVEGGVFDENPGGASGGLFSAMIGGATPQQRQVAAYLLQHGADIETEANANSGTGLLHAAAMNGDLETVRFLLQHGAKVDGNKEVYDDESDDENYCGLDETPLIAAAMDGHLEVVKTLLEAGANVAAWCDSYGSALDCATPEVAPLLRERGAKHHYDAP